MINHWYFYGFDADFGPFFIKFCGYFPFTGQIYFNGQYAERPAMPHRVGAGLVARYIRQGTVATGVLFR